MAERKLRERIRQSISFDPKEGRTKQSFVEECDINNIMARHKRTGVIDHLAKYPLHYGDFTNANDYQEAHNKLIAANDAFDALPAHVRRRMDNDPAKLMDFMADPDNVEEAQELGLLPKPSDPDPEPVPDPAGGAPPPEGEDPPSPPQPTPISGGD